MLIGVQLQCSSLVCACSFVVAASQTRCPAAHATSRSIAMKTFSSSTLMQSTKPKAKGMGMGVYTYWKTVAKDVMDNFLGDAIAVRAEITEPASASTLQACEDACTADNLCAGVVFGPSSGGVAFGISAIGTSRIWSSTPDLYPATCYLILGSVNPANTRRTLVKAKVSNMDPAYCPPGRYLNNGVCTTCAGSSYTTDSGQTTCSQTCPDTSTTGNYRVGGLAPCGCQAGYVRSPGTNTCTLQCTRQNKQWSEAGNQLSLCRTGSDCPPGYVVSFSGLGSTALGTGCTKCLPGQVPNADRTACGCAILSNGDGTFTARMTTATSPFCTACTGGYWAGPDVNTLATCTATCPTGTSINGATGQVRCRTLLPGYYYRAADDTVAVCLPGYYCPGSGTGTFDPTLPLDQGLTACSTVAAGVTSAGGSTATGAGNCNVLRAGYFYCSTAGSVQLGSGTSWPYLCGTPVTGIDANTVIKCVAGAWCPGGETIDTTAPHVQQGATSCYSNPGAGTWSRTGAAGPGACTLVAPQYYWDNSQIRACTSPAAGEVACSGGEKGMAIRVACNVCPYDGTPNAGEGCDCPSPLTTSNFNPSFTALGVSELCRYPCSS